MNNTQTKELILTKLDLVQEAINKPIEAITRYDLLPIAYTKLVNAESCVLLINGQTINLK